MGVVNVLAHGRRESMGRGYSSGTFSFSFFPLRPRPTFFYFFNFFVPPPALYERYRRYTTSALTDFKRWDYIESQTVRLMNRIDFVPAVFIRLPRDFSCFKSPAHFFDDLGTYRPPPPSHTYAHFPMLRQTSRHYIPAIKFKKKKKGKMPNMKWITIVRLCVCDCGSIGRSSETFI